MPVTAKYVGRPTKWGNPFKVVKEDGFWAVKDESGNYWGKLYTDKDDASRKAVECYSGHLDAKIGLKELDLGELKGKDLACFCSLSSPCHIEEILKRLQ